jgi:HSP20 family protein
LELNSKLIKKVKKMIHTKKNPNQEQIDRLFNVFSPWLHVPVKQVFHPNNYQDSLPLLANINDSKDAYHLALNIAGYTKEEVKIAIDNQILTVTTEKAVSQDDIKYHLREWKRSNQKRSFTLPKDADVNSIEAAYENGVLNINIQKKPKPVIQTIEIK